MHDEGNKENACVNVSVQTEVFPDENDTDTADELVNFESSTMSTLENFLDDRRSPIVQKHPFPVEVTVNIIEGSHIVVVNGAEKAVTKLQRGDTIRIYDAHESSDWKLSNDPTVSDDTISFCLTEVYDHSKIIAQQKRSRANTLNRLCYPYKKDSVVEAGNRATGVISAGE